jgi:hypothetical protein
MQINFIRFISFLTVLYLFNSPLSYSQNYNQETIDSLNKVITKGESEITEKIDIYNQIAKCYLSFF